MIQKDMASRRTAQQLIMKMGLLDTKEKIITARVALQAQDMVKNNRHTCDGNDQITFQRFIDLKFGKSYLR